MIFHYITGFTIAVFISAGVASSRRPLRIAMTRLVCSAVSFLDNFSPIFSKSSIVSSSIEDDPSSDDDDEDDEEEDDDDDDDEFSSEDNDFSLLSFSPMISWMIFFHFANVNVEFPSLIAKYSNSVCSKRYGSIIIFICYENESHLHRNQISLLKWYFCLLFWIHLS